MRYLSTIDRVQRLREQHDVQTDAVDHITPDSTLRK